MQPVRLRIAQAGPFVHGFLSPAVQPQMLSVQEKTGVGIPTRRADAKGNFLRVHHCAAHADRTNGPIQTGEIRLPEYRVRQGQGQFRFGGGAGGDPGALRLGGHRFAVAVNQHHADGDGLIQAASVFHRDFHANRGRLFGYILRVNIGAFRLQKFIKRQRDVQRIGDVQRHVAVNATHRRVPLRAVPGNLGGLNGLHVFRNLRVDLRFKGRQRVAWRIVAARRHGILQEAVVAHDGEHVGRAKFQMRREVKTERDEAVFADAEPLAVEKDLAELPDGLELEIDFLAAPGLRGAKLLAIPSSSAPLIKLAAQPREREMIERVRVIERVRHRDHAPIAVVEGRTGGVRRIGFGEAPIIIEIQPVAQGTRGQAGTAGQAQDRSQGEPKRNRAQLMPDKHGYIFIRQKLNGGNRTFVRPPSRQGRFKNGGKSARSRVC